MTLYKWLTPEMLTCYQRVKWPAPIGEWTPSKSPTLCVSGWHLATVEGLVEHMCVPGVLWEAEGDGECEESADKIAFERVRLLYKVGELDERTGPLLACDFAEHVLPIFERQYLNDFRPRHAVDVARSYVAGEATLDELVAARAAERKWQGERLLEVLQ